MDSHTKFTFKDYKVIHADNKRKHKYEWQGTFEKLDQDFFEQQTLKEEQEILQQCYQDIKYKLNVRYSNYQISETIFKWFLKKIFVAKWWSRRWSTYDYGITCWLSLS